MTGFEVLSRPSIRDSEVASIHASLEEPPIEQAQVEPYGPNIDPSGTFAQILDQVTGGYDWPGNLLGYSVNRNTAVAFTALSRCRVPDFIGDIPTYLRRGTYRYKPGWPQGYESPD